MREKKAKKKKLEKRTNYYLFCFIFHSRFAIGLHVISTHESYGWCGMNGSGNDIEYSLISSSVNI